LACYVTFGNAATSPLWRGVQSVECSVTIAAAALVTSPLAGQGVPCIAQIRHTAPSLRLFVSNSLTVHPRSFSSKVVLAASPVVSATPLAATILLPLHPPLHS
jgi:hypothetical protein